MRVMLLGAGSVGHTQRWANGLAEAGVELLCVSQHDFLPDGWRADVERVRLRHSGGFGYVANALQVARLYRARRCELLNAHYATGYGLLATLSGARPRLLSAWGSDVYDFPRHSALHAALLRGVLRRADGLASTSRVMAGQLRRVLAPDAPRQRSAAARRGGDAASPATTRPAPAPTGAPGDATPTLAAAVAVAVTPFGVDTALFSPKPSTPTAATPAAPAPLVIGTVKTLAPKYGIDTLLQAFAALLRLPPPAGRPAAPPLQLQVVGDGPQRAELQALAARLGIADRVEFAGAVPHAQVIDRLRGFDIFVAASRLDSESFGVAVIEASACGLPVVVTRAGGLPEVVDDGVTGLVVERDDPAALAGALARLVGDAELRARLGRQGRAKVQREYEWRNCVRTMLQWYRQCIDAVVEPAATGRPSGAGRPAGARAVGDGPAGTPAPASSPASRGDAEEEESRTVSVIVPCRNECRHIGAFCDSALGQALPAGWRLQLLVADGVSDDGTRALLDARAAADARLQVVANPRRIVSCGLNLALARSAGEVIVRMDVHTEYAADYVAACIAALAATGADNVGGPWHAQAEAASAIDAAADPVGAAAGPHRAAAGATQRAVAAAFQSRWVAGGALSRRLDHDGWVDTVYLGCWPRVTFERFGNFDEALVRNQDDEHNLRITRGGGRIWQSSRIRSRYRPRARLAQVLRQYLQYGYWKPFVMKKHGQAASLRHLVPGGFVAALLLAALAAAFGTPAPLAWLVGAYGVALAGLSVAVVCGGDAVAARRRLDAAAAWRVPGVIAAYHLGYGAGSLLGAWDAVRHGRGRERFAALTR